jgi:hypothetical protein
MRHFWRISLAIAPSRSRSVSLCYKNARSVTSGQPGKQLVDGFDDQHRPIAILDIGGVHLNSFSVSL